MFITSSGTEWLFGFDWDRWKKEVEIGFPNYTYTDVSFGINPNHFYSIEDKEGYKFQFNCAGLSKDAISIEIVEGKIEVSVSFDEKDSMKRSSYTDNIEVPKGDLDKISSSLKDGILEIKVPFKENKKVKIDIK